MLSHHRKNRRSDLHAENMHYLEKTKRKNVQNGGSEATNDSALSWRKRIVETIGGKNVEVEVPSLFEDQTTSWIKIVIGVQKYVREAMPIQEGEDASGRPVAKAKPILESAPTSNPNFIPIEDGLILKCKNQRTNLATRCRSS